MSDFQAKLRNSSTLEDVCQDNISVDILIPVIGQQFSDSEALLISMLEETESCKSFVDSLCLKCAEFGALSNFE